jgi:Lon protease-like protein
VSDSDGAEPLSSEELERVPVFPLPNAVFFPATDLPLHVFERRYRRMVEDCITQECSAIVVTLLERGWERDYEGRPAIHEIGGIGRIVGHQRLADGRHNILLRGVSRVRIEEVDAGTLPYRLARATVLEDRGQADRTDVQALIACAAPIVAAVRREHPEFGLGVDVGDPPGVVADRTADRLLADIALRQRVVETLDVGERLRIVTEAVGEIMAMLASRSKSRLLD